MGGSNDTPMTFSPEAIDGEIKIWESIKSYGYSQKSAIFQKNINVNNVLSQLYKAKKDNKVVDIKTQPLYVYYKSEEEKREEERKRLEEQRKKLEEQKRKK